MRPIITALIASFMALPAAAQTRSRRETIAG